ncbi:hypothetical protein LIER_15780 [Lithospermum erythrorhizon]|uniref:Uncharacterized protein n=1 Tax=Lithospermum erythrorhizon TaxID=34254 RepID=A0AAV3Q552_LITER
MLSSTIETITMVASDSFLVFLVCNFIIVVLFVASSSQNSQFREDMPFVSTPQFDDIYSQSISTKEIASSLVSNNIYKAEKNGSERESLSISIIKSIDVVNIDANINNSFSVQEKKTEENASSLICNSINKAENNGSERELLSASISKSIDEVNVDTNINVSFSLEERKTENEDNESKIKEDEEDQLQKRADEFIRKLKQHWMEEKFGNMLKLSSNVM